MNSLKKAVDIGLRGKPRMEGGRYRKGSLGSVARNNSVAVDEQPPAVDTGSSSHQSVEGTSAMSGLMPSWQWAEFMHSGSLPNTVSIREQAFVRLLCETTDFGSRWESWDMV